MQDGKLKKWENRANELMDEFQLTKIGWSFGWLRSDARSVYGRCYYGKRIIKLSKLFVNYCTDDSEIEDVIRHEIGHALAPRGCGHGREWKVLAEKVGYRPKRCSSYELKDLPIKYVRKSQHYIGVCPNGHIVESRYAPRKKESCGRCDPKYNESFVFRWKLSSQEIRDCIHWVSFGERNIRPKLGQVEKLLALMKN